MRNLRPILGRHLRVRIDADQFPIADVVAINAIGKSIWEIEKTSMKDTEDAINTALEWCNDNCNRFLEFAVALCNLYFTDHNV